MQIDVNRGGRLPRSDHSLERHGVLVNECSNRSPELGAEIRAESYGPFALVLVTVVVVVVVRSTQERFYERVCRLAGSADQSGTLSLFSSLSSRISEEICKT